MSCWVNSQVMIETDSSILEEIAAALGGDLSTTVEAAVRQVAEINGYQIGPITTTGTILQIPVLIRADIGGLVLLLDTETGLMSFVGAVADPDAEDDLCVIHHDLLHALAPAKAHADSEPNHTHRPKYLARQESDRQQQARYRPQERRHQR